MRISHTNPWTSGVAGQYQKDLQRFIELEPAAGIEPATSRLQI